MSRDDETFSDRRNKVSRSSVVGKTLNSTGRVIYIETIITMTDIMISITIRMSRRKPGRGVMSAITIARTAIGMVRSPSAVRENAIFRGAGRALVAISSIWRERPIRWRGWGPEAEGKADCQFRH